MRSIEVSYFADPGPLKARLQAVSRDGISMREIGGGLVHTLGRAGNPAERARQLLRSDASAGRLFVGIRLRLDDPLATRLARVDGGIVGKRLLDTAERVIGRAFENREGVALLRYEARRSLDVPVVEVLLSPRRRDEGRALMLPLADVDRLEESWRRASYRSFGLHAPERRDAPERRAGHERVTALRETWREASLEFARVLDARHLGQVSMPEFRVALEKVLNAERTWLLAAGAWPPERALPNAPAREAPELEANRVFSRTVYLPAAALDGLAESARRDLVRRAVETTSPELIGGHGKTWDVMLRPLANPAAQDRREPQVSVTVLAVDRHLPAVDRVVEAARIGALAESVRHVRQPGVAAARLLSVPEIVARGVAVHRALAVPSLVLSQARGMAETPLRTAARQALQLLSRAAPAPLRAVHSMVRAVGGFLNRG